MRLLVWDSRFELGVPVQDAQHRELFGLINDLQDDMNRECGAPEMQLHLGRIRQCALEHFRSEELLMERWAYPGRERHRGIHRDLLRQVEDLERRFGRGGSTFSLEILRFVSAWLTDHIEGEDRGLAEHLRQVGGDRDPSGGATLDTGLPPSPASLPESAQGGRPDRRGEPDMIESFTLETFQPLVGSAFEVRAGEASATLELTEVRAEDPRGQAPGSSRPPFSLVFLGPEGIGIGQGNLAFSHPGLPPFTLLVTPVGCKGGRYVLQAVIN